MQHTILDVGDVSEPFRTQFGYHILKVNDKRKSPGEIQVAHIMVKNDTTVLRHVDQGENRRDL